MFSRARIPPLPRGARRFATEDALKAQRRAELLKIYAPLSKHEPHSLQWEALAYSGRLWEDHFKPQDTGPYETIQREVVEELRRVDEWKGILSGNGRRRENLTRALVGRYSQQSTGFEGNPLSVRDAQIISAHFNHLVIEDDVAHDAPYTALTNMISTKPDSLLPEQNPNHTAELRNHIAISKHVFVNALQHPNQHGISEAEMKHLSKAMILGTDSEQAYHQSWGGRVELGGYRKTPIGVRSNPLRIFPYPQEVQACLTRFFAWRSATHEARVLHPLLLATHLCMYFLFIHPFPDGNGRMGRTLMADYLIRQGFLPVVFSDMERVEYLELVKRAQDWDPGQLVRTVVLTQLEMMACMLAYEKW